MFALLDCTEGHVSLPTCPQVLHGQRLEICQLSQDLLMLSAAEASRNPQALGDVL